MDEIDGEDVSVTRAVDLEAPVDDVWEAVTTPALLSAWLDGDVDVDVRPGGAGVMVEPDGAVRRMRIEEVDPARRLSLSWWPEDGSSPASTVEMALHPVPGGTRLVVTETIPAGRLAARASAGGASSRWDLRLVLLGCGLLLRPALVCW